ncbi:hypothetical protein KFE25_007296 [Diacronema lutheri]|uniref:EF-hand domain-containing protein n=1 Tax=Diacronema lutheri TaxID=2081491 RepID=A0A8J5XP07_DIALT|nr:hypothetical protein KFE25_007296 [Diacronema lutheri]
MLARMTSARPAPQPREEAASVTAAAAARRPSTRAAPPPSDAMARQPSARGAQLADVTAASSRKPSLRGSATPAPAQTPAGPRIILTPEQYAALAARASPSEFDQERLRAHATAAQALLLERGATAYEAGKALLRTAHLINQYVSLGAGGLVCFSAGVAAVQIVTGLSNGGPWLFGLLTQLYIFLFGAGIIILEVPIVERTKAVLAFKLFVDKWLRAFSRLTARGFVYVTHAILIIDAQENFSYLGEVCGAILMGAGALSAMVGLLTTQDIFRLKASVRGQLDTQGNLMRAEAVFTQADIDRNGRLSKDEVLGLVKRLHPQMSELQVDALYVSLDTNRDGTVTLEEFMVWYDREEFDAEDLA